MPQAENHSTPYQPSRFNRRRGPVSHLQEARRDGAPPRPSIVAVVRAASAVSGVAVADLLSPSRRPWIAQPRQVAMCVAYEIARGASLTTVGHWIGRRDHTTVLHAIHTVKSRMARDPAVAEMVRLVKAKSLDPDFQVPPPPAAEHARPDVDPTVGDNAIPPPRPEPTPRSWIKGLAVRKARLLRRRGWSVTGIAKYLNADAETVAIAVGELPEEVIPASARNRRAA